MDFLQTIKAEHAKANDVIDKLGDTSEGAVKTRERLTSQLRTLLDEHSRKEEDYLYPMLIAQREAKDFLEGAYQAHEEIKRMAGELDAMEKGDSGFLPKLKDLEQRARQHMREEERLLSSIRKSISEVEIRSLDEAFSGAAPEAVAQEAKEAALEVSAQVERGAQSVMAAAEIFGKTAQLTAEDMQAITTCSTIAAGGMSEMRQAWIEWLNRALRANARASQDLLRCTTIEQLAHIHRGFLKESLDNLLEGSVQILRISSRISEDARRPIEDRVTRLRQGETRGRGAIAGQRGQR